jgi:hypothetical protein
MLAVTKPAAAFCGRGDDASPENVVMLLDFTDKELPRPQQFSVIESGLRAIADGLPQGSRLGVLVLASAIADRPSELGTLFDACKPRDPAAANPICETRRVLEKLYTAQWQQPLEVLLQQLKTRPRQAASTSPLLASVKLIADRRLLAGGGRRRLIMVTDLREHSDVMTTYPRLSISFAQLAAQHPAVLDVDLSGVEICVLKMAATPRSIAAPTAKVAGPGAPTAPGPELAQFWTDWSRCVKAKEFSIRML